MIDRIAKERREKDLFPCLCVFSISPQVGVVGLPQGAFLILPSATAPVGRIHALPR